MKQAVSQRCSLKEYSEKILKILRQTQELVIRRKNIFPTVSFLTNLQAGNLKLAEAAAGDGL